MTDNAVVYVSVQIWKQGPFCCRNWHATHLIFRLTIESTGAGVWVRKSEFPLGRVVSGGSLGRKSG